MRSIFRRISQCRIRQAIRRSSNIVKGELSIHHGPEYRVMTNDPPYDEMIDRDEAIARHLAEPNRSRAANRQRTDLFGSPTAPGISLIQRIIPRPSRARSSLLRIAQVPFRDPARAADQGFWGACQTNWVSAADVTNGVYYVNSATVPSLFWLDLKEANFKPGAPLLFLDPHDPKVGGDARRYLKR